MRSSKKIDLLNSEGPCVYGVRVRTNGENAYIIYDQWHVEIAQMDRTQVQRFLEGEVEVTDTRGRMWNWAKESQDMKPNPEHLKNWLYDDETM